MSDTRNIDWDAAANSPEFKELAAQKRRFVVPATIFFLTWYFGFIILAGVAPDFMGEKVIEGVTIGYIFALSQFVMVWVLAAAYLRRADKVFDPLAAKAAETAVQAGAAQRPAPAAPEAAPTETSTTPGNGEVSR
ncbi:MAG: hypothetical protein QOI31_2816 [Solirubrobacterales bacterium]|jgi:uncharacterized membrane protein (DUF485 family)|nr:hypothetical protein [Solirubrobacterales bacterium]